MMDDYESWKILEEKLGIINTDFVRPLCGLVPIFLKGGKGILVDITTLANSRLWQPQTGRIIKCQRQERRHLIISIFRRWFELVIDQNYLTYWKAIDRTQTHPS